MAGPGRVYSERFCLARGNNVHADMLVPAGYRAIVRCFTVCNLSLAQGNGALFIAERVVAFWLSPGEYGSVALELRHVAYEGEWIQMSLEGPDVSGCVSGYLLKEVQTLGLEQLPADPPPPTVVPIPLPPELSGRPASA